MAIVEVEDNYDIYEKIFKLIKKNKWDDILKLLQELDVEIDINMKDQTGNYIISYAVLHNRLDIIKILHEKNVQLDVLDSDNRSILYIPIKYGYDAMLEYLLQINSEMIGVSIIDIKDRNFKTPIHYAIISKNIFAIKKLLEANCNLNTVDNKGYNALHYAILSRDIEIVKLILPGISNINTRTTTGETSLHLAVNLQQIPMAEYLINNGININLQDYSHEFSALHYAVSINNKYLIELLLDVSGNPNTQDVFGNTPLHYVMIEESYNLIDQFINSKKIITNLNLYNIDGKLPLHILLDNFNSSVSDDTMKYLILNSNLAIIDNDGNSCLFLLVGLGLWKKYKNELIQKRLDIYSKNKKDLMVLDLVNDKDKNEFIELIIDAYMHRLRNKQKEWGREWENICSKEFINVDPNELKKIFTGKIDSDDKLIKVCRDKIRTYLFEMVEKIKDQRIKCAESSYPLAKNKMCITLEEGETLDVCTFTGTTLDVLLGLIYLLKKH
jgi:ankyrin repeat protein